MCSHAVGRLGMARRCHLVRYYSYDDPLPLPLPLRICPFPFRNDERDEIYMPDDEPSRNFHEHGKELSPSSASRKRRYSDEWRNGQVAESDSLSSGRLSSEDGAGASLGDSNSLRRSVSIRSDFHSDTEDDYFDDYSEPVYKCAECGEPYNGHSQMCDNCGVRVKRIVS